MEVKGRNLLNGLPENINFTTSEVREALLEPLSKIIEAIKVTLEKTPPELSSDIMEHGITLCGGTALLKGLDTLINHETGIPVYIAEFPIDCLAVGTGQVMENFKIYSETVSEDEARYF